MEQHFHHHHQLHSYSNPYLINPSPPPPPPPPPPEVPPPIEQRERLPQWSHAETLEFLAIRAELDHDFLTTKRNKPLWEAIAARLLDKGYVRTADQCKSKWKNLVTRFKGSEAMEQQAAGKQFPFQEEMRRIFSSRMERLLAFDKKKGKGVQAEGKEWDDDDDDNEGVEEELKIEEPSTTTSTSKKKRKAAFEKRRGGVATEVEAALREFMRRQMEMEERWLEAAEAREAERRAREEEWRRSMVALGEERLTLVRRWREREDERIARAEARAERRDQLITAILTKLTEDES